MAINQNNGQKNVSSIDKSVNTLTPSQANNDQELTEEEKEDMLNELPATALVRVKEPTSKIVDVSKLTVKDLEKLSQEEVMMYVSQMSPQQVAQLLVITQKRQEEKSKKAIVPFSLQLMEQGQKVYLTQLIDLDKTPIKFAVAGMRPLDADNVEKLTFAIERGDKLPPLKIKWSTMGPILIGGYHRKQAMLNAIKGRFLRNPLFCNDKGELNSDGEKMYKEQCAKTSVDYIEIRNATERDLPKLAREDNLTHGKGDDEKGRANYAIFLVKEALEYGETLKVSHACLKAGVSRAAFYAQVARNEGKKDSKSAIAIKPDKQLSESEQTQLESFENSQDAKRQPDVLDTAIRSIVASSLKIANEQIAEKDLAELIQKYVKDDRTYQALVQLSRLLQVTPFSPPMVLVDTTKKESVTVK